MHILGLPTDIFNVYPASIKYKTYQARWQIGDIYVSGDARKTEDNPQGLGCYLVMTGRGCDDIFCILDSRDYTFGDMFRRCERRYGRDNFHFTRLDIAIDDKNEKPFFTIEQIKKKCEKEEFISNSEGYHFDESKFDDFDTAKTVYIGAGKSGLSYRFYDKDKEVCSKHNKTLNEVGSWKRTEMQLRDDIFRILDSRNYTFGDMFKHCERRYGLDNFHFTRLDIAIDDKNEKPFFTIEQIKKKCEKEEFISNSEGYHFDESKFDDFDTAKTVYIGAGKSGLSYRFYDKDKEVCSKHNKTLEEVDSWKRTEMQLRDDKAHAFAMTFKDRPLELGELAFGLLANNLRFVVPNRNESNKSRWKTCRFWERFLGAVEVLKLQVPKLHNSLEETQQWLTEGGVISAVKSFYFLEEHDALGGLEKVGTMLDKARYSNSLSSKLTAHLQRINRTDLIPYIQYDTKHGKGGI